MPTAEQVERTCSIPLHEHELSRVERHITGAPRDPLDGVPGEPGEQPVVGNQICHILR